MVQWFCRNSKRLAGFTTVSRSGREGEVLFAFRLYVEPTDTGADGGPS